MVPEEQQELEELSTPDPLEPSMDALLQISRWIRQVAVVGIGIGAFVVMTVLFGGAQSLAILASSLPGGTPNAYTVMVITFFIVFFLVALVLFYLLKASQLLFLGVQQKNTEMLSQAFGYLKSFFIVVLIVSALRLAGNLINLF